MTAHDLPFINACLNGISTVLLCAGFYFIKSKRITAHRNCMISAFVVSCIFLAGYLYHKYVVVRGVHTPFPGPDMWKVPYLLMLFSHIVLAAAVPVLALMTISRGLKMKVELHKKIARWTFPIWLYVSITGVLIYVLLYVVWAPAPAQV
jgi:putative membrane protein